MSPEVCSSERWQLMEPCGDPLCLISKPSPGQEANQFGLDFILSISSPRTRGYGKRSASWRRPT